MTDEEVIKIVKVMSIAEREVITLCSREKSWGYDRLAEKSGLDYFDVRMAGKFLQSSGLATVRPVRLGREFNGSAIFLNERGECVKAAIEKMKIGNV